MSKVIDCLKLLSSHETVTFDELMKALNINFDEVYLIVEYINDIEPGLVCVEEDEEHETPGFSKVKITSRLSWYNLNHIKEHLLKQSINNFSIKDYKISLLPEVKSTNSYVLENLDRLSNNTVVLTEMQTQGRGRYDRVWESRLAHDFTLSFLYHLPLTLNLRLLPLISALAVARLFYTLNFKALIKWPNDIMDEDGNKIGGILVEVRTNNFYHQVVIGIGINNLGLLSRDEFIAKLIYNIDLIINEYCRDGFSISLKTEWLNNCIHYEKLVEVYSCDKLVDLGIHKDLSGDGNLVVSSQGKIKSYDNALVRLRLK